MGIAGIEGLARVEGRGGRRRFSARAAAGAPLVEGRAGVGAAEVGALVTESIVTGSFVPGDPPGAFAGCAGVPGIACAAGAPDVAGVASARGDGPAGCVTARGWVDVSAPFTGPAPELGGLFGREVSPSGVVGHGRRLYWQGSG